MPSAEAAKVSSSISVRELLKGIISLTASFPKVKVPVLSKAIVSTFPIASRASPDLIIIPCFVACPIAAIIAVGVANTSAQGQNTTSTVTEDIIFPVTV